MGILFENNYILTKEFLLEITKPLVSIWLKVYCTIGAVLCLIYEIVLFRFDGSLVYKIISLIFAICFIMIRFTQYKIVGKKAFEQQKALNNYKTLEKTIYFYDDKLEVTSVNGARTIVFYNNIKKYTIQRDF